MTFALASFTDRVAASMAAAVVVLASQFAAGQEPPKNFVMHDAPKPVAAIKFDDTQGQSRNLAEFKGKVVLLNIWATWCGPCRKEMPALDRLQAALAGPDFEVVALSIDRGVEKITKFYAEIGIRNLPIYIDVAGRAPRDLGAAGVPTTFILDRAGQEVGRVVGPAEWDASGVVEFLKPIIAKQIAPIEQTSRDVQSAGPLTRSWQWLKALLVK